MSLSLTPIMVLPMSLAERDDYIQVSRQLFTQWQLEENKNVNISLGQKTITTKAEMIDLPDLQIHVPENILSAFYLPLQAFRFQALFRPETKTLRLGPVIGLLTDFTQKKNGEPNFRSIHLFCEELHRGISAHGGFFYVFAVDDFSTQGYYLKNDQWISARLPTPDVIYNRIHSRLLEHTLPYKQFRQSLEQFMIPFFNDRFLSKWEVYEQLASENQLNPYIPETKLYSEEHFQEFIQKYNTIFLKPIHGSQGRNIIKITKEAERLYSFQSSISALSNNLEKKYSFYEIGQEIKPLIKNSIYIIQQGIDLMSHQSCAMDFRVLCHLDLKNHWVVTSTVARIAAEQEFVSNLARGGTITRPLNALCTNMSHKKSLEVLRLIKELALETATVISRHTGGLMGELGIDIGIDQDGRPWLIEVNSKPSKKFEDQSGKIRPSTRAIIQLCTKLAFE